MLNILCKYAPHPFFVPPAPDGALNGGHDPFPFVHEPNTFGWNRIVVPTGWDSRDKIVVVRNNLNSKAWGGNMGE